MSTYGSITYRTPGRKSRVEVDALWRGQGNRADADDAPIHQDGAVVTGRGSGRCAIAGLTWLNRPESLAAGIVAVLVGPERVHLVRPDRTHAARALLRVRRRGAGGGPYT
jgi:hypothetical protein